MGSPVLPGWEVEDKFFDRQKAAALELGDQDAAHANLFCWSAQAEAPELCQGVTDPLPLFYVGPPPDVVMSIIRDPRLMSGGILN